MRQVLRLCSKNKPNQAEIPENYRQTAHEFLEEGKKPLDLALLYNSDLAKSYSSLSCSCSHKSPGADESRRLLSDSGAGGLVRDDRFVSHEMESLQALGHRVVPLGLNYSNLESLRRLSCDFAFNCCEGTGLDGDIGLEAISILESRVIPFSGVGSAPFALTNDKWIMKQTLKAAGAPVPEGFTAVGGGRDLPTGLRFPLFVKPRFGFGSQGVSEKSVVYDEQQCREACERILALTGTDPLVEEYIPGREITVGIIGGGGKIVVMPPLEVEFDEPYLGQPKIRMFDTKNNPESSLYWGFHTICPAPLGAEEAARVEQVALTAYLAVEADGYGRVDMRLGSDGVPYVLEVNGNCSLEELPDEHDCAILPLIGRSLGWSYPKLLAHIIGAGKLRPLRRYRPARMVMRKEGEKIVCRATRNIPKGTLIQKAGHFFVPSVGADEQLFLYNKNAAPLFPGEPHVRFMLHSAQANAALQWARGALWLAAVRTIKEGEELTLDRRQAVAVNAVPGPLQSSEVCRKPRKRRRLLTLA